MTDFYFKGGTSSCKARAYGYIRDRLPVRPVTVTDGNGPAVIRLPQGDGLVTKGPVSSFADRVAIDCRKASPRAMVERFVDATGVGLLGYDSRHIQVEPELLVSLFVIDVHRMLRCDWLADAIVHSFALDPVYADLPIDITVDANKGGFRSRDSAAYCGAHAVVGVAGPQPGLLDEYDVSVSRHLERDPSASSIIVSVGLSRIDVGRIVRDIVESARSLGADEGKTR